MRSASGIILALLIVALLAGCHGDDDDSTPSPTIAITHPTAGSRYETPWTDVRLGGTLSHASFVHALNTRTGDRTDGYVNYVDGYGSWFADIRGLQPGGTGRATTGDAYAETAGAATSFTWVLTSVDAIQINDCPACSFQTISRISGATTEGLFLGETASTGSTTDTNSHAFELTTGTL